jgi:hypothetical protein
LLYTILVEFHKDFVLVDGTQITIGVRSKPKDGEANLEIIKKLAKYFGVSSANVSIKSGHKSREKIVEIV